MILKKFNIELHLLNEANLDILRQWRNSDFVRQYMQFRGEISKSDQEKWFTNLDKSKNYYFLIKENNDFIGCCNIKNIDENGCGEGGVFVSEERYLKGLGATKAVFLMYHWAFNTLGIKSGRAEILSENKRAIRFNKMLGFKTSDVINGLVYGELKHEDFNLAYKKYEKFLKE